MLYQNRSKSFVWILTVLLLCVPALTVAAPADHIIISEVQYDPSQAGTDTDYEWIELYNPTSGTISLSGWSLHDNQTGYSFSIGATITPGQYFILANSGAGFAINYPAVAPDAIIKPNPTIGLQLANGSDRLLLKKPDGSTGDYVTWTSYASATAGNSICRKDSADTDTAGDWLSNCSPTPKTGLLIFQPYLTLIGLSSMFINLGDIYTDSGAYYTSFWGTGLVSTTGVVNTGALGTYPLNYYYSDLSGNVADPVSRSVTVSDFTAPVIILSGANPLTLDVSTGAYIDSGASWTDNADGSGSILTGTWGATGSFAVSGTVNMSQTGAYYIEYRKVDLAGNSTGTLRAIYIITPICTPGSQLNGSGTVCQPCAPGSYNPSTGGVCMYADPGSFVGVSGATGQSLCAVGYYAPNTGQNACIPAPMGSYIPATGATGSLACPIGTYNNLTGQPSCTDASIGYYTRQTGSTGELACPQGSYNPLTGQSTCILALLGSYVSITGASASLQCSAGTFSNMLGSTSCTPCGTGYDSATGAVSCMDVGVPVVDLIGSGVVIVAHGSSYTDSGASWTDNADGSGSSLTGTWGATGSFAVSGTVNTSQTGTYYLYYKKVDLAGNSGEAMRTIVVTDQEAPQVVTIGSGAITILLNSIYVDSGASWTDAVDGSGVVFAFSGYVNTGVVGTYLLEYTYVDAAGNTGNTAGRHVIVSSGSAPVVTINGSTGITQQAWLPYVELGAIYDDLEDGTGNVTLISGVVNTGMLGTYVVTYNYTDTHGNPALQQTRTITITAPTCTPGSELSISGSVPSCLPCDMGTYNPTTGGVCINAGTGYYVGMTGSTMQFACSPGYYTDMLGQASCTPAVPGRYVSTTGASEATQCAIGYYTDTVGQVSCIAAPAGYYVAVSGSTGSYACIPGTYQSQTGQMSCTMADPGNYVPTTGSSTQQMCPANTFSNMLGSTSCIPCASGYTSSTGSITCTDTQGPVIILSGLTGLVLEVGTGVYTDSGASWTDNADGSGTSLTGTWGATGSFAVSGTVNLSQIGTYYIYYFKVDSSGNTGMAIRTIIVQDMTPPPPLAFNTPEPFNPIFTPVSAIGGESGSIVTLTDGSGNTLGSGVVDGSGRLTVFISTLTETTPRPITATTCDMYNNCVVDILPPNHLTVDTTAPVITLAGGIVEYIDQGTTTGYAEPGATWTDNLDGSGTIVYATSGIFDLYTSGTYLLEYRYVDRAGNTGLVTRTLVVRDILAPTITLLGSSGVTIAVGSGFVDPGASWTDLAAGSGVVTAVSGVVNTGVVGMYILSYRYIDPAGNMSNVVTRTVTVAHSTLIDTDGDGNTDTIENAGNNGGDGNGDGLLDSEQTNVASTPNTLAGSYTTLETTGGCTIVSDFDITTEPSLPVQDAQYSYPLGLNNFRLACSGTGQTAQITVYYDKIYDTSQWLWRKFDTNINNYVNIGSVVSVSIGSKVIGGTPVTKVTFTITDGGLADEDGLANAIIIDPSGPAVPISVTPSFGGGGGGGSNSNTSPITTQTGDTSIEEEMIEDPAVVYEDIFNPDIDDGYCYTRRSDSSISPSLIIKVDDEFGPALSFMYAYELTRFNAVDDFAPYSNLTREQAAKLFSNFAINVLCRKPDVSLKINYTDTVNADPTLKPYIALAYQLGLMKGGEGRFRPSDTISKAEFNAVLIRMILKSYLDESGSTWYTNYNGVATDLGIITQGAGLQAVNRHNAALMLFRAYKEQEFSLQDIDYESFVLDNRGGFVP